MSKTPRTPRNHFPKTKAMVDSGSHATDALPYAAAAADQEPLRFTPSAADIADAEQTVNIDAAWASHKSDLDWPSESNDPFLLAIGIFGMVVLAIGVVTVIGCLGYGLWQVGAFIIHSLH